MEDTREGMVRIYGHHLADGVTELLAYGTKLERKGDSVTEPDLAHDRPVKRRTNGS